MCNDNKHESCEPKKHCDSSDKCKCRCEEILTKLDRIEKILVDHANEKK